ncbi:lysozyme C-like [Hypanus sabinus]|uniref:lysozyme C-like n=1 Tax=Hypanus sabinus TaxID=79690 RepID=UPI0028C3F586|nr:lysozyme C-like [Hypanus sabinus]
MKTLFLLSALLTVISPRTYEKCELARELRSHGLDGYQGYRLEDWVCLVKHESSYRTDVVNHNWNFWFSIVSTDYGLFQINSKWWCEDGNTSNSRNGCGIECIDLLDDDITDDVQCAKRVVSDPQGMRAWYGWKNGCQRDLSNFLSECSL